MSLSAYQRTRTITEHPRATECRLMRQITGELIAARDAGLTGLSLKSVLSRNREVWNVFTADCGTGGNKLPVELRASIVSLGLWVERYTSDVMTGRDDIEALIDVNRSLIEGLEPRGSA